MPTSDALRSAHQNWVAQSLSEGRPQREPFWTESVAVGGEAYIERIKSLLGAKVYYRSTARESDQTFMIKESEMVNATISALKK